MARKHSLPWAGALLMVVSIGCHAETYGLHATKTLPIVIQEGVKLTHTLTPQSGLNTSNIQKGTTLATGTFSGGRGQVFGFEWTGRDAACGTQKTCSRIYSSDDHSHYIDMTVSFPGNYTDGPGTTLDNWVTFDVGAGGTSGLYTLTAMTDSPVSSGSYRVQTEVGVYTP